MNQTSIDVNRVTAEDAGNFNYGETHDIRKLFVGNTNQPTHAFSCSGGNQVNPPEQLHVASPDEKFASKASVEALSQMISNRPILSQLFSAVKKLGKTDLCENCGENLMHLLAKNQLFVNDLLFTVFQFVSVDDLVNMELVCKQWLQVTQENNQQCWKFKYRYLYGSDESSDPDEWFSSNNDQIDAQTFCLVHSGGSESESDSEDEVSSSIDSDLSTVDENDENEKRLDVVVVSVSEYGLQWKEMCMLRQHYERTLPDQSSHQSVALERMYDSFFSLEEVLTVTNNMSNVYWHTIPNRDNNDESATREVLSIFIEDKNYVVQLLVLHDEEDSTVFVRSVGEQEYRICLGRGEGLCQFQQLSMLLSTEHPLHFIASLTGCLDRILLLEGE